MTLSFVTTASSSGGAKVALWTFQASGSGDAGFVAFGPNSDPTNIAGLTGTATYTDNGLGKARINVVHDNSGSFGVGRATGQVSLVADFDADTISGSIFNITDNGSDVGYSITNGASITLEATSITGNTFNSGLTLAPSQFGLSDLTAGYASGMFYGSDGTTNGKGGTTIGGTLTGTGTSQVTGGTAVISGGFVAE